METNNKHIELAKKLMQLAQKGVGGEKVNASKMLDALLKKHNLTIQDLEGEKISEYSFKVKKNELRLFSQIVSRVNLSIPIYGSFTAADMKVFNLKVNYMIKCTAAEYIEIDSMFSLYNRLYKEELGVFFKAFCRANDLYVKSETGKKMSDLTDDEFQDWLRVNSMASKIKSETIRKQITD